MSSGPVRKFNMAYLLAYIFVPLIVCVLTTWAAFAFFPNGGTAAGVLRLSGKGLCLKQLTAECLVITGALEGLEFLT